MHRCPECDAACDCGGDTENIVWDESPSEGHNCVHWQECEAARNVIHGCELTVNFGYGTAAQAAKEELVE